VNKDGTKLSKRQGDISIKHYRDLLFYPEALTNFVTKSGGGFADHNVNTIFTHGELANFLLNSLKSLK
jgi:glutamyl-tRNA synthetase